MSRHACCPRRYAKDGTTSSIGAAVYVRISVVRPVPSAHDQAARALEELTQFLAGRPGYLAGYRLETESREVRPWSAGFPSGLLGRVTCWESEADADASAQTPEVTAMRLRLNGLAVENHEYAFYGTDVPRP